MQRQETYEDHDLVDTVDELGREVALDSAHDERLGSGFDRSLTHVVQEGSTEVTSHDDDRVLEVNNTALTVSETTIVEDLQELARRYDRPFSLTVQVGIPEDQVQRWTAILIACYSVAILVGSPFVGIYADRTSSRRWPLLIGLLMLLITVLRPLLGTLVRVEH